MNPLVSVLMTAYNREKYIAMAIESVLASTYANLELIVVDDGSKDRTVEICNEFAKKDQRVKVFVNEHNLGDYPNRNKAASYAKGEYLKYVDADDYIYPWGLEILVREMEKFPNAGLCICSLKQHIDIPFPLQLTPRETYRCHYFGPGCFHKSPLSTFIRRSAFEAVGGFTGKQHMGDFEFWHLLARRFNVVLMVDGIVWSREHDDQQNIANLTDPRVNFKYLVGAYHFFKENDQVPLEPAEIAQIMDRLNRDMNRAILRVVSKMRFAMALELWRMKSDTTYKFGHTSNPK